MVGGSLLLGGWRNREQHYNLQGANAYLGVDHSAGSVDAEPAEFHRDDAGADLVGCARRIFLVIMSVGLYAAFLAIQTGRHRGYFTLDEECGKLVEPAAEKGSYPLARHATLLIAYMVPVPFLARTTGASDRLSCIETLHGPAALGGVIIAMLVATPGSHQRHARGHRQHAATLD